MNILLLVLGLFTCIFQFIPQTKANNPQIFVTIGLRETDTRIVEGWSGGGGDVWLINNHSNYPFSKRELGSAVRWGLKGTQIFGSGYPYGKSDNGTIAGRDFPYGMWPIYWGNNTMGSDEYGPALDGIRPGGQLVTIPLTSTTGFYSDLRDGESYYIIADRDSAIFIMLSFVDSCHVLPVWPTKFDPTSPNSTAKIENVISYYRASSFALASPDYINAFPTGDSNTESTNGTPLPDLITSSKFHKCLNDVILNALPIMNQPPEGSWLSGWAIFGIFALALILGIPFLYYYFMFLRWIVVSMRWLLSNPGNLIGCIARFINSIHWKLFGATQEAKRQQEIEMARRAETLKYEHFP